MQLSDFSYTLPDELIAHSPAASRTGSRLMAVDSVSGGTEHGKFTDLQNLLRPGDLLIFNDTRVIPARLFASKASGGKVELLVERVRADGSALVQIRASKSPKPGNQLFLCRDGESACDPGAAMAVQGREESFYVVAPLGGRTISDLLEEYGHIPLPPYIRRSDNELDIERYQTVYARNPGAVAAPTAGLHFDEALLSALAEKGVDSRFITLHVGAGTFQPVRVHDIAQHTMHKERVEINAEVCAAVSLCKERGGRVIAVGTTSVRSLESAAVNGVLQPYSGETDIFIYPGFDFQIVDAMVTNFHLPESTLLMLVSAFSTKEILLDAYNEAVKERYRFFSYGDAMFLY